MRIRLDFILGGIPFRSEAEFDNGDYYVNVRDNFGDIDLTIENSPRQLELEE